MKTSVNIKKIAWRRLDTFESYKNILFIFWDFIQNILDNELSDIGWTDEVFQKFAMKHRFRHFACDCVNVRANE